MLFDGDCHGSVLVVVETARQRTWMDRITCRPHLFLASIIQHSVWSHIQFPLSYRDVEDLPAERGIDIF